jgi:ferredoxin, 2Fe-2S
MPKITYVEQDGTEHLVNVPTGWTVMEGAVNKGVPGITADCGGACACATCHVYIDEACLDRTGRAAVMEQSMLELASNPQTNSRLSCQIKVTDELDGLRVNLPSAQT